MIAVGLVLFLAVNILSASDVKNNRIVNGREANITEFPYQVAIESIGMLSCGGAIIHPQVVITAGHCLGGLKRDVFHGLISYLIVRVGASQAETGGQTYYVASYIRHHEFADNPISADVALLLLESPIHTSTMAEPISLINREPQHGEMAEVTGYGSSTPRRSKEEKLRAISIPVVSLAKCRKILSGYENDVTDGMICAGAEDGKDACQGDSGGPLAINGELAGLTSWGIGCGRTGLPGIYTNIFYYRSWIISAKRYLLQHNKMSINNTKVAS